MNSTASKIDQATCAYCGKPGTKVTRMDVEGDICRFRVHCNHCERDDIPMLTQSEITRVLMLIG